MSADKGIIWKSTTANGGVCCFSSHRAATNWAGPTGTIEPVEYELSTQPTTVSVDDLAALIRRLARHINKETPNHPLVTLATDYLDRHQLSKPPLRSDT